jgi:hypothetical protein
MIGYISSGFFGGLALGRIALVWFNTRIGERRVIYIYAAIVIALDVIIWRVPSLIGDAVAVSFIGFFLGILYSKHILSVSHEIDWRVQDPCFRLLCLTPAISYLRGSFRAQSPGSLVLVSQALPACHSLQAPLLTKLVYGVYYPCKTSL